MLNTLINNLVTLLTTALIGTNVTVSATGINLKNLTGPQWFINLQGHQSLYQNVRQNLRSVTLQLTYVNDTSNLTTWETTLRESMWTILQTLETANLGEGITWSAEVSEGEAVTEYSEADPIPAYKLRMTLVTRSNVRS